MRVNLFSFQEKATIELREKIAKALLSYRIWDETQVISLQAPTGSGKTIIAAALIERIYQGMTEPSGRVYERQPDAIFVWLSDSPELNNQSKEKIELTTDKLRFGQCEIISEDSFDMEMLEDGHIYFLNTQKLSKKARLTHHADGRQFTIWETLDNTIQEKSDRLYFIIDEAHRGTKKSKSAQGMDTTIMQRFIKGYEYIEDGRKFKMHSMPVVLGISATAERFHTLVKNIAKVVLEPCTITAAEVRESGLLKDKICVIYPEDLTRENDYALLDAAVEDWIHKCKYWKSYTEKYKYNPVDPVFVIQVSPGSNGAKSNTDLSNVFERIEKRTRDAKMRPFQAGEVVHCFGDETAVELCGLKIPHVNASDIANDHKIKIVFFKEALSTGWDCPRAETMMSFAVRNDPTYIAQLLGRMVRTPLQRRIIENASLNDVKLFLPHYNKDAVKNVIDELHTNEGGNIPIEIIENQFGKAEYALWTVHTEISAAITSGINRLQVLCHINEKHFLNYCIQHNHQKDYLNSLLEMASLLTRSLVYKGAREEVNNDVINMICAYVKELHDNNQYELLKAQLFECKLSVQVFDPFGQSLDEDSTQIRSIDQVNLERQLERANKKLGGYGFPTIYGRKYYNEYDPDAFKIDCILYAADENCILKLSEYAKRKLRDFSSQFRTILSNDKKAKYEYDRIMMESAIISEQTLEIPEWVSYKVDIDGNEYCNHLFADKNTGIAKIRLNGWESALIDEESLQEDFVCWLRNRPRASGSLCLPYEINGEQMAFYPDFLIVRRDPKLDYVIDVLEPHGSQYADTLPKAKSLAEYAKKEKRIARIQLIRKASDASGIRFIRLDLTDFEVQEKVLHANTDDELNNIFSTYGFSNRTNNLPRMAIYDELNTTASKDIVNSFRIRPVSFLRDCEYLKLYTAIEEVLPADSITFSSFGRNESIICETICAAICHQMNWDYLRQAVFSKTMESKKWLEPAYLASISEEEVELLFSKYPKKDRIRKEERTVILRIVGSWLQSFPCAEEVLLSKDGVLLEYDKIRSNILLCEPFVSDPEGKKFQLLIQKLSVYPQFSKLKQYYKPAIDYHLVRTYIRRGLLFATTKYADEYLSNYEIKRKENTVAGIRQRCSELMLRICSVASMDVSAINQIDWQIGRSVCVQDAPDCFLEREASSWLKPAFTKCPFFDTCESRKKDIIPYLTVNEPSYKGTSY